MSTQLKFQNSPFVLAAPSAQNAVDLFENWASLLPAESGLTTNGKAGLFVDERIQWLNATYGAVTGRSLRDLNVLELGPLEAGHTTMLERLGVGHIDAIEANGIAYLKCLVVKELFGLQKTRFQLGNVIPFLKQCQTRYDLGLCLAFLNHLTDPVSLLRQLSAHCDSIYVWNVTYNERLFQLHPEFKPAFGEGKLIESDGLRYTYYPHYYGDVKDFSAFWGGVAPSCCWMTIDDYLQVLGKLGYSKIQHQIDDNYFGDALRVFASR
ncbi:hypothetical protein [Opitutus sp. ER46]|uniref:hypothetical protein n=1 Tax=Opitutus sp. ER46 TaxID=2161864 RepID=UPI000D315739|nr:hypothetical protein [Opitutus sp. ER46]PTX98901.1 hypothetical protein DB354_02425 [Opitutus sp. ER46]